MNWRMSEAWVLFSVPYNLGFVVHTFNSTTLMVKICHPWLSIEIREDFSCYSMVLYETKLLWFLSVWWEWENSPTQTLVSFSQMKITNAMDSLRLKDSIWRKKGSRGISVLPDLCQWESVSILLFCVGMYVCMVCACMYVWYVHVCMYVWYVHA